MLVHCVYYLKFIEWIVFVTDENEINDIIDDNPIEEDEEDDDELPSRKRKLGMLSFLSSTLLLKR